MRNCISCGAPMADNVPVCPACGIGQPAAQPPQGPPQGQYPQGQYQGAPLAQGQPYPGAGAWQAQPAPPQGGAGYPMQNGRAVPPGAPPPYGRPMGGPGMPPYGQPPQKNKTGLIIGLVAGGVVLLAAVALLLYFFVFNGKGNSGLPSSISSFSTAPSSSSRRPSSSSSAPSSSAGRSDLPMASSFEWMLEPEMVYDSIRPVPDFTGSGRTTPYIAFYDGSLQGVALFTPTIDEDGRISDAIIAPYNGTFMVYECGYAHGFPADIESMDIDQQNAWLASLGLPFETDGGHGGFNALVFGLAEDGSLTLGYAAYGEFYVPPEGVPDEYMPEVLPVFDMAVLDMDGFFPDEPLLYGLATKDGEILLDLVYDQVYLPVNGVCTLEQGGRFGYYSLNDRRITSGCFYDALWTDAWYPDGGAGNFENGYCPVAQGGRYGFINERGDVIVPMVFEGASHVFDGMAWVKYDGKWGLIRITG